MHKSLAFATNNILSNYVTGDQKHYYIVAIVGDFEIDTPCELSHYFRNLEQPIRGACSIVEIDEAQFVRGKYN